MARPILLQMLRKGKVLSGAAFPGFVDTFNYAVNRCENLTGDHDTNPQDGYITVDNADPEHPVIRLAKIPEGSASAAASVAPGCFALDEDLNFINRYYRIEQYLFEVTSESAISKEGLYYLEIAADSPAGASVKVCASISAFNSLLGDSTLSCIPLYLATADDDGGYAVIDFRNIPTASTWSVYGMDE